MFIKNEHPCTAFSVSLPQFYNASSNFFLPFFVKEAFEHKYYYHHLFFFNCVIVESIQEEQLFPQSPLTSSPSSRSLLTHILAEALALKCYQNGLFRCEGERADPTT